MVVVLDNAAIHLTKDVSAFVETVERLTLIYLLLYSPAQHLTLRVIAVLVGGKGVLRS